MRLEEISGVHVMRMSGPRVLLIFDSVEVQQQVTQSGVLDSISSLSKSMSAGEEERCDQVDARGTYNVVGGYDDGVKVQVDDGVANGVAVRQEESLVRSLEASLGRVCWRGNGLWNGHEGVSDALVPTVHEEQLVDVAVNCIGPVVEGSTTEELVANGYKRKVRLLTNVISSLHSPEEKRKADKALQWWGRGCPRKSAAISEIVDISLTNSDLLHRKEAILKEAEETVKFDKLLGAKTIGCEAVIVQDIARILGNSQ
ncbi:hypothetical protein V6N13_034285 [Hibiscus sabdariffa]